VIELRTIRIEECNPFLELLCTVFELDFERARTIFYSEPYFDVNHKWALIEDGKIATILTTTPLQFGWGEAIGISGVATAPHARGRGLAGTLLNFALEQSRSRGTDVCYLFARQATLYERSGFHVIDEVIRAQLKPHWDVTEFESLDLVEIQRRYNAWSVKHPDRLRRDSRRWKHWQLSMRFCEPIGSDGYLCTEGQLVREIVRMPETAVVPILPGSEWMGLRSLAEQVCLEVSDPKVELMLMSTDPQRKPQMFLTDQF